MTLAAIDWGKLFELVWAAAVASLVVSGSFSLTILGVARAGDARRDERAGAFAGFAVLAVASAAVFVGAAVFGVMVILAK
jgi:hypothetical protein